MKAIYNWKEPFIYCVILMVCTTNMFSQELKNINSPLIEHKELYTDLDTLAQDEYIEKFVFNYRLQKKEEFMKDQKSFIISRDVFNTLPVTIKQYILTNGSRYRRNFDIGEK